MNNLRWNASFGVCILTIFAMTGCKSLKTKAVEQFGVDYSCPANRIQAHQRDDIRATTLFTQPEAPAVPPEEVRSDPARFAVWQANQARAQQTASGYLDFMTVFEVTGCDGRAFYACARAARVNGNADPVHCTAALFPPQP